MRARRTLIVAVLLAAVATPTGAPAYASRRSQVRMFCYSGSKAYFMER